MEALPRFADVAANERLRSDLRRRFRAGFRRLVGLDAIFASLGEAPGGSRSHAIRVLLEETDARLAGTVGNPRDLLILGNVQRIRASVRALAGMVRLIAASLGRVGIASGLECGADRPGLDAVDLMNPCKERQA